MKHLLIGTLVALGFILSVNGEENEKHLFFLSGQSNMAGLDPYISFTPTVEAAFGKEERY